MRQGGSASGLSSIANGDRCKVSGPCRESPRPSACVRRQCLQPSFRLATRKGRIRPPSVVIGLLDGTLPRSPHAAGHAADVPTSEAGVDVGPCSRQDAGSKTLRRRPVESGGRCPRRFASKPHEFLSEGFSPSSELGASDRALPAFSERPCPARRSSASSG